MTIHVFTTKVYVDDINVISALPKLLPTNNMFSTKSIISRIVNGFGINSIPEDLDEAIDYLYRKISFISKMGYGGFCELLNFNEGLYNKEVDDCNIIYKTETIPLSRYSIKDTVEIDNNFYTVKEITTHPKIEPNLVMYELKAWDLKVNPNYDLFNRYKQRALDAYNQLLNEKLLQKRKERAFKPKEEEDTSKVSLKHEEGLTKQKRKNIFARVFRGKK